MDELTQTATSGEVVLMLRTVERVWEGLWKEMGRGQYVVFSGVGLVDGRSGSLWNCIGSELVFRLEFGFSCRL